MVSVNDMVLLYVRGRYAFKALRVWFFMDKQRNLADDAHALYLVLHARSMTTVDSFSPFTNKSLSFRSRTAFVSTRVYDVEHAFCYSLTFPYQRQTLRECMDISSIVIDCEPFTRRARFTIRSAELLPSYDVWATTPAGIKVQQKEITLPDGLLVPVMAELAQLAQVPLSSVFAR